jgi:hypothetical protein
MVLANPTTVPFCLYLRMKLNKSSRQGNIPVTLNQTHARTRTNKTALYD